MYLVSFVLDKVRCPDSEGRMILGTKQLVAILFIGFLAAACVDSELKIDISTGTDGRCEGLSGLNLIDMKITQAETVVATEAGPSHCRVSGVIEREINFELLLPEEWNG